MRRSLTLVLVLALVLGSFTASALASKGQGNGNGRGNIPPAVMVVTPNPLSAFGGIYAVTGSGFNPNQRVVLNESRPTCCASFNVMADSAGNISFARSSGYPGTYELTAWQKKHKRYWVMAEVTFEVVDD